MKEAGKEIKQYTELNGRYDSNLIDTLNALYNYQITKEDLSDHMDSKEISLAPFKQGSFAYKIPYIILGAIEKYEEILNEKALIKIEAIKANAYNSDERLPPGQIPEYAKKLKTLNTIPPHL